MSIAEEMPDPYKYLSPGLSQVGTIEVKDTVTISDPMCQFHQPFNYSVHIVPGEYRCIIEVLDLTSRKLGLRIACSYLISWSLSDDEVKELLSNKGWQLLQHVNIGVDGGNCGYCTREIKNSTYIFPELLEGNKYMNHPIISDVFNIGWCIWDNNFFTRSGLGDGDYNLYQHATHSNIDALKLEFLDTNDWIK